MLTLVSTACALVIVVVASGCTRGKWPDPPPVDPAKYQQEYDAFQKEQLETAGVRASAGRHVVTRRG
jgi:hypothetical protein